MSAQHKDQMPALPEPFMDLHSATVRNAWVAQMHDYARAYAAALRDRIAELEADLAARQPVVAEPVANIYAEARECRACEHIGINDSSATLAACDNCEWSGPSPKEDHCPGCDEDGTMMAACPKCGALYRLLAEAKLPLPPAAAPQPATVKADVTDEWIKQIANATFEQVGEMPDDVVDGDTWDRCFARNVLAGARSLRSQQGPQAARREVQQEVKE